MSSWRAFHDLWFPPGLETSDGPAHREQFLRWFAGGLNAALPPFAPMLAAARTGALDHWAEARGRFVKVFPNEYKRALGEINARKEADVTIAKAKGSEKSGKASKAKA